MISGFSPSLRRRSAPRGAALLCVRKLKRAFAAAHCGIKQQRTGGFVQDGATSAIALFWFIKTASDGFLLPIQLHNTSVSWFMDGPLENHTFDLVKTSVNVFSFQSHTSRSTFNVSPVFLPSSSELDKCGSAGLWGISQLLFGEMLTN